MSTFANSDLDLLALLTLEFFLQRDRYEVVMQFHF